MGSAVSCVHWVKILILFLHQISYTSIWDMQSVQGSHLHLLCDSRVVINSINIIFKHKLFLSFGVMVSILAQSALGCGLYLGRVKSKTIQLLYLLLCEPCSINRYEQGKNHAVLTGMSKTRTLQY